MVALIQTVALLTIAMMVADPPTGPKLVTLLWAQSHRLAFYPLALLLTAGPVLSWLAWRTPGKLPGNTHMKHRLVIVCLWCLCLALLLTTLSERTGAMLRVLWWQLFA